jgi:hypothetical protein
MEGRIAITKGWVTAVGAQDSSASAGGPPCTVGGGLRVPIPKAGRTLIAYLLLLCSALCNAVRIRRDLLLENLAVGCQNSIRI